jgi:hypothetical protein
MRLKVPPVLNQFVTRTMDKVTRQQQQQQDRGSSGSSSGSGSSSHRSTKG